MLLYCIAFVTSLQLLCNPSGTLVQLLCNHFVAPVQSLCPLLEHIWQHRDPGVPGAMVGDPILDQPLSEPSAAMQQDAPTPEHPYHLPSSIPPLWVPGLPFSSLLKDREHI